MFALSDIEVAYGDRTVLRVDDLRIATDAFTVVLGHNGSGKSTLMNLLARLFGPGGGEIRLDDIPLGRFSHRDFARRVAYLPQRLPEVAGLNVRELCGLGRFPWRGAFGRWTADDTDAIDRALEQTDMTAFSDRLVDRLSGGERQRAWVAMLLAQDAPILLLDEPTAALDVAHQIDLLALLRRLNETASRGVIAILHDVNLPVRYADRILALKDGTIAFDDVPAAFMDADVLSRLYGVDFAVVDHPSGDGRAALPL